MAAILNLCQKVAILERGRLTYVGPCPEGVELYTSRCHAAHGGESGLSRHPHRRESSRRPILQRIRLLNGAGTATDQFHCGEPMTIELEAEGREPAGEFEFLIGVEDSFGTRLFTVGTYLSESGPLPMRGRGAWCAAWTNCRWPRGGMACPWT